MFIRVNIKKERKKEIERRRSEMMEKFRSAVK